MNSIIKYKLCAATLLLAGLSCFAQGHDDEIELGYGVFQKAETSTASVDTISGDELRKSSAINLKDALYGNLLGLQSLKTGGFEGDSGYGASFTIRGKKTPSSEGVLVLVDGFERPIDRISLEEVESVTVLKDAAALALYGYKGTGGAILVKTKRGSKGDMRVNANYAHKLTFDPQVPEFVNGYEYASALNQARSNDGLSPAYNIHELEAFRKKLYPDVYPDVNWKDEVLRNMGQEDQANLSVYGGTDNVRYYTLFNYVGNSGLLSNTDENEGYSTQLKSSKANVRMNLDVTLTPTTEMKLNVLSTFIETSRPHNGYANSIFDSFYSIPASAFPVMTEDGTWGGNTTYGAANPLASIVAKGYDKNHSRSLMADIKLIQNLDVITKGLSASVRAGYDSFSEITESRGRGYQYKSVSYVFDDSGKVTDEVSNIAGDKQNHLSFNRWLNNQWRRFNLVGTVDYTHTFGEHNINASLVYTGENYTTGGRYQTIHRQNVYGYMHYDLGSRYVADIVLGATGSNRSYPNKWDFSPVLSLGWVISNEDFMKDNGIIDLLKVRASAGIMHTDYIPKADLAFENYEAGSAGTYYFGSSYNEKWGFFLGYTPTSDFLHETSNKFNIGLDSRFLGALSATMEFYYERRSNILQNGQPLASSVYGIPSAYVNKGIVDSKGVEIGLRYNKSWANGFALGLGGQFTWSGNEIVDWVEAPQAYPYLSKIGTSLDNRFALEAIGLFKDEADIASSPVQEFGIVRPGDIKFKDQNGDKVINDNDVVAQGNFNPAVNYAFDFNIEYKGIGMNALFQGVSSYDIYLSAKGVFRPMVNNSNLSKDYLENCWKPGEKNDGARYPRLTTQDNPNNFKDNSLWFTSGDFLKLRHCEVYYRLPGRVLDSSFVKDAKISLRGENLLSFSSFKVFDPEINSTAYPILKSVCLGVSVTF